jgi:lipopolysaccharide export system permease protein
MLSLALCGLSAWINLQVGPQCRVAFKNMLVEMGLKIGNAALPEGRFVKDFSPYIFYIGRNDGQNLHSILLSHLGADHEVDQTITADRGKFEIINGKTTVTLYEAHELHRDENGTWGPGFGGKMTLQFSPDQSRGGDTKPSLSDMTFGQLRTELRELESSFSISNPGKLNVDELKRQKKLMEQVKTDLTMPARVQIHRQIATSFACLGFTLVGIPLGIRAHRRETNIGIAMALALVLVYYSFLILGQSLQTRAEFAPYLIMWLPNFIFQSAGMVMLWRANKGI